MGSTFAPASQTNASHTPTSSSRNPYHSSMTKSPPSASKKEPHTSTRALNPKSSSPEQFPDYRAEAFADYEPFPSSRRRAGSHGHTPPSYQEATSSSGTVNRPRRGSSLKERYPGDKSHQPLDIIRRDSKKAYRSPHLHKRSIPGADSIDRLDPAVGGIAYHHEGPYDAALLSRNRNPKNAPLGALETSNQEALKATPQENIKDALERHKPLDGVAVVPPGEQDRFGRVYKYEEGADLMHEPSSGDAGYKRWPGKVCHISIHDDWSHQPSNLFEFYRTTPLPTSKATANPRTPSTAPSALTKSPTTVSRWKTAHTSTPTTLLRVAPAHWTTAIQWLSRGMTGSMLTWRLRIRMMQRLRGDRGGVGVEVGEWWGG